MFIRLCTDIKHKTLVWFQILAEPLEEPLVTVDLSIVSLLHSKYKVYSSSFQDIIFKSEIPGLNLEHVNDI